VTSPDKPDRQADDTYLGDLGNPNGTKPRVGEDAGDVVSALSVISVELGETRAQLAELRDHLGDQLDEHRTLARRVDSLGALATQVTALASKVEELLASPEGDGERRPVDLAHIDPADRPRVLGDLVAWVRDVVFVGWPWTQQSLRWCWLQHPDLVNGMLWLRAAYAAAYEDPEAKPHHSADWHRWLEEVMKTAERRTEGCPVYEVDGLHMVPLPPRDDSDGVKDLGRRDALATLYLLAQQQRDLGDLATPEQRELADRRMGEIIAKTRVTEEEYNLYAKARAATEAAARKAEAARSAAQKAKENEQAQRRRR
jgi:hypothetical protein